MLGYRIVHKNFSHQLSASGLSGRWNNAGKKVIYFADSIALAFLENMIRRQGVGFNDDFNTMVLHLPEVEITVMHAVDLKAGWNHFRDYSYCQPLGDNWYERGETLLLKVPSAVLPGSYNYLISTTHPAFDKIKLLDVTPLVPDKRIDDILKKYGQ